MMSLSWRRACGIGQRHTGSWATEHEYHRHLFFLEYGLLSFASSSSGRLILLLLGDARDMEDVSDLLNDVGCHRGHDLDQASERARRAGGRLSVGERKRVQWLRDGVRECNMRQRRRERLR